MPKIVLETFATVERIAAEGVTMLLQTGRIVMGGAHSELERQAYLGI